MITHKKYILPDDKIKQSDKVRLSEKDQSTILHKELWNTKVSSALKRYCLSVKFQGLGYGKYQDQKICHNLQDISSKSC